MFSLRKGPSGPKASGSGADIAPFSFEKFVDPATLVPLTDQDGSVSAPYSTMQGAIDANLGVPITLALVGTLYPEDVVVPVGTPVFINSNFSVVQSLTLDAGGAVCFLAAGILQIGALTLGAGTNFVSVGSFVVLGDTAIGAGSSLQSFVVASLNGPTVMGSASQIISLGGFTFGSISDAPGASNSALVLAGPNSAESGIAVNSNTVAAITMSGADIKIVGADVTGPIVDTGGKIAFEEVRVSGDVTCDELYLRDTSVLSGDYTTTGRVQVLSSNTAAANWNNALAFPLELDAFSNYWIKINGTVITNPGAKVITNDVVP
jgi:hypothetical protein